MDQYIIHRSWMYERTMGKKSLQPLFKEGVRGFVAFITSQDSHKRDGGTRCPCLKCTCRFYRSAEEIITHLEKVGFMEEYWLWSHHGEGLPLTNTEVIHDIRAYANRVLTECGKRPLEPRKPLKNTKYCTYRVLTEAECRQLVPPPPFWIPRVKDSSSAPPLYSTPFPWPIPNPAMVTHGVTTSLSTHSPENITTPFSTLPPPTTQPSIVPEVVPDEQQQQQREEADPMQQAHQFQEEVEKQDGRYVIYLFSDSLMPSNISEQYIKSAIQACYKKFWPHYGYLKDEDKRDVFDEFRKHCVWEAHHEAEVKDIFHHRARSHLSDMLLDEHNTYCGNSDYQPGWIDEDIWNQLLHYWATDARIKIRPEAGKRIRASMEGGFLHSKGCVSAHTHAGEDVAGKGANYKKFGLGSLAPNMRRRSLFDVLDNAEGSSHPPELTPEMHTLMQQMTQQLQAQSKQLQTQSQTEKELRDQLHQEVEHRRVFEKRIEQQFASHNRPPIPSPVEIPQYDSEEEYS